jgi:hypothetical protein
MCSPRAHLAALLGVSLGLSPSFSWAGSNTPLGILTVAYSARLNNTEAFPGVSLFDDETLSTEPEGRLAARVGRTAISLGGSTVATLHLVADGTHVDLARGVVLFKAPAGTLVEVHAEGALLRAKNARGVQAEIKILAPKTLQVSSRRGDLEFLYREERRVLLEGETYRIRLDSLAGAATEDASGAQTAGISGKVIIVIVAAAAAGVTAWGVHAAVTSGNGPESPAKP